VKWNADGLKMCEDIDSSSQKFLQFQNCKRLRGTTSECMSDWITNVQLWSILV